MKKILGIDFDGTVVEHEFPNIGADVPDAVRVLKRLQDAGVHLILWTMRSGSGLNDAVAWFTWHGIELWGINENPEQSVWTDSPKAYAQGYIDDLAIGCPLVQRAGQRPFVNWVKVDFLLEAQGFYQQDYEGEIIHPREK